MKIHSYSQDHLKVISIEGRFDGLTAAEIRKTFEKEEIDGQRFLAVDLSAVTYMSSAGLRVVLHTHKTLAQIGGKLILIALPPQVSEVFHLSGMDKFLHILPQGVTLSDFIQPSVPQKKTEFFEFQGIKFSVLKQHPDPGNCFGIGSSDKLKTSSYESGDVVRLQQGDIRYGAGLAVLGNDYEECKSLFGESIVIGHHFFSYPAVGNPYIDYAYYSKNSQQSVNFLHGFGFNGDFSTLLHFEVGNEIPSLKTLVKAAGMLSLSGLFGVVILGRSGGILGMSLKKSPIRGNEPLTEHILDTDHLTQWLDFSLDAEDVNKTLIAVGLAFRENTPLSPEIQKLFPIDVPMHFHAAVFHNRLISHQIEDFYAETERVCRDFEVEKVVHLLPESGIKSGFLGIVNLKNS